MKGTGEGASDDRSQKFCVNTRVASLLIDRGNQLRENVVHEEGQEWGYTSKWHDEHECHDSTTRLRFSETRGDAQLIPK